MNPVSFDIIQTPPQIAGAERLSESDRRKLWGVSREMEAMFNGYMLGGLGDKLPGAPDSFGSQVYAGMFKDVLSHQLAAGQHNGLARSMYEKLARTAGNTAAATKSDSV